MLTPDKASEARPNGAAWACVLAAGIGCVCFGTVVELAEASKRISNCLNFYNPTGDLSGKTTVTISVWLLTWMLLHYQYRRRHIRRPGMILTITVILIAIGFLAVFPPIVDLLTRRPS